MQEFAYFQEQDSEQFAFYKIPKVLFTDPRFNGISTEAKIMYLSLIHISEPTRRTPISDAVFCLKKFFFNDTATTEIYTV